MTMVAMVMRMMSAMKCTQSRCHHKASAQNLSAHLACVDICEELIDFDERFLLLRVFDLVGDAKVDSESKVPERGRI